jgi:hypothetical protein
MMADQAQDLAAMAREYQQSVLEYESLAHQIAKLLSAHGGVTRNLSDEDYAAYRELAERRDLAYNRMRTLERTLLDE